MKLRIQILGMLAAVLFSACSGASFENVASTAKRDKKTEELTGGPGSTDGTIVTPPSEDQNSSDNKPSDPRLQEQSIKAILSSNEVSAGKKPIKATAELKNIPQDAKVKWLITGPKGIDIGSIDDNGNYISPENLEAEIEITVTVVLVDNETLTDSVPLKVIPNNDFFFLCSDDGGSHPIVADVYRLPTTQQSVPKIFDKEAFVDTICLDEYNVPEREFSTGFPKVKNLFEYFALKTYTKIVIPQKGNYVFKLTSDDGAILKIGGVEVINNDGLHQTQSVTSKVVPLNKGDYEVNLNYFQGPRFKIALQLFWRKPGDADFSIVPKANFKSMSKP